jgi:hypothetical protein
MPGERLRIPLPFDVVHSGSTTTTDCGYLLRITDRGTNFAPGGGVGRGEANARKMACKRDICCTRRVCGYDAVNIGSKMAARYKQSIGDVNEEAIMVPCCGRRF